VNTDYGRELREQAGQLMFDILCRGSSTPDNSCVDDSGHDMRNPLPPEILEPRRRQFGVPDRVLNVFVPKIRLQRRVS
jgi:hypothetical protein